MKNSHCSRLLLVCSVLVLCLVTRGARCDELTSDFYDWTCPGVYDVVQQQVFSAMREELRMGASLLRLHFHDCFVNVPQVSSELTMNVMLLSIYCCVAVTEKECCDVSRAVMIQSCWMVLMARNLHYPTRTLSEGMRSSTQSRPTSRTCAPGWCPVLTL